MSKCSKANHLPERPKPAITSSAMRMIPYSSASARTPCMYSRLGIMMPAVPGMDSRMIAAIVAGPSNWMVRSRWCSARSVSSASVAAWNSDR